MGFGQLLTVQRARSQANHSHVPDSWLSVGNTGQNLFVKKHNDIFSSTLCVYEDEEEDEGFHLSA